MKRATPRLLLGSVIMSCLLSGFAMSQSLSSWSAESGVLPDQMECGAYSLYNVASSSPVLTPPILTLSNAGLNEYQYYGHSGPDMDLPATWEIEFECRLVSGSSGHVARAPIGVGFTNESLAWNSLYIGVGEAFLLSGNVVRGQTVAISTTDDFHTYRIVVNGASITVYYDNTPILSGNMFTGNGPAEAGVWWGIVSGFAISTSEWRRFEHNGSSMDCTSSAHDISWGEIKAFYRD